MANPLVSNLVRAVEPDFDFSSRDVHQARDSMKWFKVNFAEKTLYVPPVDMLKKNPMLLDKFCESITAFSIMDFEAERVYNWDHLNEIELHGNEPLFVSKFKSIHQQCKGKEISCDIETKGLEWKDNFLIAFGIAIDDNTAVSVDNIPIIGSLNNRVSVEHVYKALYEFFNDPEITFVWHNGKFDCGKLRFMCHLPARVDEDTLLLHYVGVNEKKGTHGLKELGQLYLQAPAWDDQLDKIKKEYCRKHKVKLADFTYDMIPSEVLIPYMRRDVIATLRLLKVLRKLQRPESEFIYRKLIEASEAYMQIELNGIQLDVEYLEDLEVTLENTLRDAQKNLDQVVLKLWDPYQYVRDSGAKSMPKAFSPKSPKQLKWMLEKAVGHPVESTDALMIEHLRRNAEEGSMAQLFLDAILDVRKMNKYIDTYVTGLRNVMCNDQRIRGTFNLHGTETGRLSSTNPNMQNIPRDKRIKNLLVAKKGYKLIQLDYSQAELRVLAALSGDPYMIQVYKDGKDLHDAVATEMFGPGFTKEQRVMAKTINFGIAYGRGAGSIAETFNRSMAEAKGIIESWFRPMPRVKAFIEGQRSKPRKGLPCTTIFGRERHFVITEGTLNHIQNEYINTPIQSAASDLTMLSLLSIHNWLNSTGVDARIVTTVHDSIILECVDVKETVDLVAQKCMQIMAETPAQYIKNCEVPFKADAETGYKWGELEEWGT